MKKQNVLLFGNDLQLIKSEVDILRAKYKVYCVSCNTDIYIDEELNSQEDVVMLPYDLGCVPFFEEARNVIADINNSFKDLKTRKPHYLYELNYLCEGGVGQRYADYLYAMAFFKKIIRDYEITIVYSEKIDDSKEIDALKDVVRSGKLKFRFVSRKKISIKEIKKRLYFVLSDIPGISLLVSLETQLQYIFGIKRASEKCQKDSESEKYDIGYVLTFNSNKHINWLLEALREVEGKLSYCIFCYRADIAREKLVDLGKPAKSVEGYFDLKMALKDWKVYLKDAFAIRKQVRRMPAVYFDTIDITRTIGNYYITYHLFREKIIDIVYERIVYEFLQKNQVKMMTGGSTNYISAKLFYFNTLKLKRKLIYFQDITKYYHVDFRHMPMEESEPYAYIMNLRFAVYGSERIEILRESGWQGDVYYLPDSRSELYYKNSLIEKKPKQQDSVTKILWAPSYPFAGIYSLYDFMLDNETILQELAKYDCEVNVKYHPGQQEGLAKYFDSRYEKSKNIKVVSQYDGVEQYLDWADVVFTTNSTILIDAALKGKLVICLASELNKKMMRDDVKESFYLVARDHIDFDLILFNTDFRLDQIARQDSLLEKWFYDPENQSKVEILQSYIENIK